MYFSLLILWLICCTRGKEVKFLFVHNMKVTALSDVVEVNRGVTCQRWSASDEMDHMVCGKELPAGSIRI